MQKTIKLAKNVNHYVPNLNGLAYIDFSVPWKKYIIRILSKTSQSTRITKAMSSLTHLTCYYVKVDLYPKSLVHSRFYYDQ